MVSSWMIKSRKILNLTKTRIISIEDAYMQMMLHENEDYDDDILLDAMNVLGFEWVIAMLYKYYINS